MVVIDQSFTTISFNHADGVDTISYKGARLIISCSQTDAPTIRSLLGNPTHQEVDDAASAGIEVWMEYHQTIEFGLFTKELDKDPICPVHTYIIEIDGKQHEFKCWIGTDYALGDGPHPIVPSHWMSVKVSTGDFKEIFG